jgi:2-succinyl-5-enolpyruvyl-6-hydroxy-3-cyclohexene-1-carboxylate synthase
MTTNAAEPYSIFTRGRLTPSPEQVQTLAEAIIHKPRGLIICGPSCPAGEFPQAVTSLARRSGFPILADSLSNVRHGDHFDERLILGGYHWWLPSFSESVANPEIIIRFGAVPTSSALAAYLERTAPAMQIHIREDGEWADDLHLTRHYIQADPERLCVAVEAALAARGYSPNPTWSNRWAKVEADTWERIDALGRELAHFDGAAVRQVLAGLPEDATLFAGNSMPVRHIDAFDRPSRRRLAILGNRGASGIDGNISTALGAAAAGRQHVVAILGDITFYHDMNGLLAVGQHKLSNVTFIVVNNDGGGIFHRLPIAALDPPFTDLFLTPHGLTFAHAAALYGLRYVQTANTRDLELALHKALEDPDGPQLIEINTNSVTDYQQMRALSAAAVAELEATGS